MTEYDDVETLNGILIGGEDAQSSEQEAPDLTLYTIFNRLIAAIFFPGSDSGYASLPLLQRIKASLSDNIPLLRDASRNSARHILAWTRRGSPLRALFVFSVGTIAFLSLTGLSVFLLFFVAATFNAVVITFNAAVISLLMSLAAAGGFLALFSTCIAAIYVGALAVAVFVISTTTVTAVIAVLIATGWIGFIWTLWLAAKKSFDLGKRFLNITGSAVSSYSNTTSNQKSNILEQRIKDLEISNSDLQKDLKEIKENTLFIIVNLKKLEDEGTRIKRNLEQIYKGNRNSINCDLRIYISYYFVYGDLIMILGDDMLMPQAKMHPRKPIEDLLGL